MHLSVVVRDDRLVGATLLGDTRKVAFLTQAFDRGHAAARAERLRLLVDLSDGAAEVDVAELPADAAGLQLQRRDQGHDLRRRRRRLRPRSAPSWTRTRAGKGCGSCKSLVKQIVEWAADGDLTSRTRPRPGTCRASRWPSPS